MVPFDHVGKSGMPRATPLVYMPDEDRYSIVAAKEGHPATRPGLWRLSSSGPARGEETGAGRGVYAF